MDYEELESRIEVLEHEIKKRLTWGELIWSGISFLVGIAVLRHFGF